MAEPASEAFQILNEDVAWEILSYLSQKDIRNLSLVNKDGFEMTRLYFEKQTHLIFSNMLSIPDFKTFSKRLLRNYKIVSVDTRNCEDCYDIVFQQLNFLKINVNAVILKSDHLWDTKIMIPLLKNKYKTLKHFFVETKSVLENMDDLREYVEAYESLNISVHEITSLGIVFTEAFDEEFFNKFLTTFSGLKELSIYYDIYEECEIWPPNVSNSFNPIHNLKKVTFHFENEPSKNFHSNFLKIFRGLEELVFHDGSNRSILKSLLELNRVTLKTLVLDDFMQSFDDFEEDCCDYNLAHIQLQELNLNCTDIDEMFMFFNNQLGLKKLTLNSVVTDDMSYDEELMIPKAKNLAVVEELVVKHGLLNSYLPPAKNLVSLKIKHEEELEKTFDKYDPCSYMDFDYEYDLNLGRLILEHLTYLNIDDVKGDLLLQFVNQNLKLPNLERLKCEFNMHLLKKYPKIKILEVSSVNYEDLNNIFRILPNLEVLEANIVPQSFTTCLNYLTSEIFKPKEKLKFVDLVSEAKYLNKIDILGIFLPEKSKTVFCNFQDGKGFNCLKVVAGITMQDKDLMINFIYKKVQN